MKRKTTCIVSGILGALFAVACGAVTEFGVEAIANSDSSSILTKTVYEVDCNTNTVEFPVEGNPTVHVFARLGVHVPTDAAVTSWKNDTGSVYGDWRASQGIYENDGEEALVACGWYNDTDSRIFDKVRVIIIE